MSFLDKFEAVKVTSINKISEGDLNYCMDQELDAKAAIKQVEQWQQRFVEASEVDDNKYFYFTGVNTIYVGKGSVEDCENSYSNQMFSPLFDILHTKRLIKNIKNTFISRIERYFNSNYGLKINLPIDYFEEKEISYNELVDLVIEEAGGLTLTELGVEIMKNEFNKTIYWKERYTVKGKTLSLNDYVRYDSWDGSKINYTEREKQAKLRKALTFFEIGEAKDGLPQINFNDKRNEIIDFSKEYHLSLNKIESVRFYKNGKLTIKFKSAELAEQFERMFNLHTIESR